MGLRSKLEMAVAIGRLGIAEEPLAGIALP